MQVRKAESERKVVEMVWRDAELAHQAAVASRRDAEMHWQQVRWLPHASPRGWHCAGHDLDQSPAQTSDAHCHPQAT